MAWNLIGHGWAANMLQHHITSGQVRHAYLFTGPMGVGKRTLALRFAQALNCERRAGTGEVCQAGERACRGCRLIPRGSYPDLHLVQAESGRSALRVEQVRELQRHLALAPYEGRWRIALLSDFQRASHSAANALLKMLEEPPPSVVMLLTAQRVQSLLPTIVSRCEVLTLRALPVEDLVQAMRDRGQAESRARLLASLAGGRPGRALALADDSEALQRRDQWLADLMNLLSRSRRARFAYVDRMLARKDLDTRRRESTDALETWLGLWRDATLMAFGAAGSIGNPDRRPDLDWLVKNLAGGRIVEALRRTEVTLEAVGKNANPQLALETLMLDLPFIGGLSIGG